MTSVAAAVKSKTMSNEEKNTPENEQAQESSGGGLLDKITHAVDDAIDSAADAVEGVVESAAGAAGSVNEIVSTKDEEGTDTPQSEESTAAPAPKKATETAKPKAAKEEKTSTAPVAAAVAAAPRVVGTYSEADTDSTASERNERKTRDGIVVSNKMDKTISVKIERRLQHPIYGKFVKKSKKLIAHDETNQCQIGDIVRIMECRPLSRRKRWRLITVLEQAK
ncbi:hypothetical protein LEM8419_00529 [Neolewinella maritima]|uniref:Small ribosomal subunit protein uS17 n=1 Tax=Neolewinella maritima TaxID=1383882 RepID=A0ABM9AWX6_9BACT|nr:hypothetical protein LEM8419_00529 [Neolewinella maritima]